jgi:ABC-type dipeptide/oligopeptide/nickel transport system permease subunit
MRGEWTQCSALAVIVTGIAFSVFGDGLDDALRAGRR